MFRNSVVILAGVTLLGLGIRAVADDATTNPSTPEPKTTHSRIVAPFNLLPDLTDDQKDKIRDIHSQTLDAERANSLEGARRHRGDPDGRSEERAG